MKAEVREIDRGPVAYSIGRRLSKLLALQTVMGLGVLLAFIYLVTSMLFAARNDEALRGYSAVLTALARSSYAEGGEEAVRSKMAWLSERRPGNFVAISRADGSELYRDATPDFDIAASSSRSIDFQIQASEEGVWIGTLVLDCSKDEKIARHLAILLVVSVIAGAAFVGWGTFWRVRRSLRPLLDLADQTRGINARSLRQRLSVQEPADELQPLIDQFNGLMQRVEYTYAQLEGFNADVAHELRTPLANLIGETELALSRERSATELEETMYSNLEELRRMSAIVNDMLFLAQADRGVKARCGVTASLAELVRQVVEFHEASMEERGLSVCIDGDALLSLDAALVKRAISNLLGNAIRYAEPDSPLCVRIMRESDGGVQLWVENIGPSIKAEHLPRLFDRFFRGDHSRSEMEKPHHGLGLSIVAAIARMHNGIASAESADGVTRVGFSVLSK